jgi:hypothetical protein
MLKILELNWYIDRATGWTFEKPWFDYRYRYEINPFSKLSRQVL